MNNSYVSQVKINVAGIDSQDDAKRIAEDEMKQNPTSLYIMQDKEDEQFVVFVADHYDFLKKVEPETAEQFTLIEKIGHKEKDDSVLNKNNENPEEEEEDNKLTNEEDDEGKKNKEDKETEGKTEYSHKKDDKQKTSPNVVPAKEFDKKIEGRIVKIVEKYYEV